MTRVVEMIPCEFHKGDNTPSLAVYEDGHFYCYGCRKHGPVSLIGREALDLPPAPVEKEDLTESMQRILSLPTKLIRGLTLPYDDSGYYIVWPENQYYKKRYLSPSKGKYRCPKGHVKPPFFIQGRGRTLILIEGELNALSLSCVCDFSMLGIGGAGDLNPKMMCHLMPVVELFDKVLIITDNDSAGVRGAIEAKTFLTQKKICSEIFLVDKNHDCNDMLQKDYEGFKKWSTETLGVPTRMHANSGALQAS